MTLTTSHDLAAPDRTPSRRMSPYWRSLSDLENTPEFQEFLHREFPEAADIIPEGVSRRRWMQLMGASFALATAQGCRWQTEKIAPFVERPEGYIPGATTRYATSIDWAGASRHLLVTCYDGRPIKVEGNDQHPGSLGATDAVSQAATLSLYDPDRQSSVIERLSGEQFTRTWDDVEAFARKLAQELTASKGAGLAVLMQPTASLSLNAALSKLFEKFPEAKRYEYAPLAKENEQAGAEAAFGQVVRTHYKLQEADVVACFDSDLLVDDPEAIVLSRAYADRRDPDGSMNRLYAVESQFSVTGAAADHRLPLASSRIVGALAELLNQVKQGDARPIGESDSPVGPSREEFIAALAEDLLAAKGRGVVVVGPGQPPEAHALAHQLNALLENAGKTVVYTEAPKGSVESGSISDLMASKVDTLLILGGNPVYDAPVDLVFADWLKNVSSTIHLSPYDDETSRFCQWSLPETHPFETWGDAPAWDGTISVSQPLIEPLLAGLSALELVSLLAGDSREPKEIVRSAIEDQAGSLDDDAWRRLLHDGFLPESAAKPLDGLTANEVEGLFGDAPDLELVFTSGVLYDGRLANNGWLQETPDFVTKLTWDNAAVVSPTTAKKLNVKQGELLRIDIGEHSLEMPVFLVPGQAEGSVGVALGYGRTAAGRVGGLIDEQGKPARGLYANGIAGTWAPIPAEPVGFDAYALRESGTMSIVTDKLSVAPTGRTYLLATTQDHHAIDPGGLAETDARAGELIREASHEHYQEHDDFAQHVGHHVESEPLWNELTFEDGRAWGMAIDLNRCIGCNACSVACQAENNVPVVGKDMVSRGREMHWIRIDRYFRSQEGDYSNPTVAYQPVACQHCETAPCEQVCPVAATLHSDEGLNDMVYNRCVGTRYCANNCPFKVRRFNYFHYNWEMEQANNQLQQLVMNPEVTVRHRGVMEKCTYCVQRITAARNNVKEAGRPLQEDDIVTACQQACPTRAITFGDLKDPKSAVRQWHDSPRSYGMLDGLNLKPRTKYLARIRNPHPKLAKYLPADPIAHEEHHHHDDHNHDHGHGHHHDDEASHGDHSHEHEA